MRNRIFAFVLCAAAALLLALSPAEAARTSYPVTIDNGDRQVTFEKAPERVVTNGDGNIIELMFALDLDDRLAGYAGFPEYGGQVAPDHQERLKKIPVAAPGYITLEVLLGQKPDLFLSGYQYGTSVPGDTSAGAITPDELEKHGVKCYNITESLIRVMKKPPVSLEDTYTDLRNLGVIFDVQDRAEQCIAAMKERAAAVEAKLADVDAAKPIGVFIYQTWNAPDQPPRTVGGQAMPSALMKMAKARNVFDDIDDSYVKVTWEDVVGRNPDVILLLECGNANGAERKKLLMEDPVLQGVKAIQDDRVIVMRVEETYPGPRAALGLEAIARALYPDRF